MVLQELGKSTIATTVAKHFRSSIDLELFLFFDRSAKSEPSRVIRTLAYQLGSFDSRIGVAISTALTTKSHLACFHLSLSNLLVCFWSLYALWLILTMRVLSIVILDALDECAHQRVGNLFFKVLAQEFMKLPAFIRIVMTSRPSLTLSQYLTSQMSSAIQLRLLLRITTWMLCHIFAINWRHIRHSCYGDFLEPDWPGEEKIQRLCESSAGLFVCAPLL
jgi:hypothetical protein